MRPYFKAGTEIATSSSVESMFAEYKSRLFKGIPMRVDKFVISHLSYIDGRMRLDFANAAEQESEISAEANIQKSAWSDSFNDVPLQNSTLIYENIDNTDNSITAKNTDNPISTKSTITNNSVTTNNSDDNNKVYDIISDSSDNSLNYKENWMGLIDEATKKYGNIKKKTYLDKCPEWDSIESSYTIVIPIMKNGNLYQPVKLQGENIMIRNTCAFDALLHITIHMIGMHNEYKQHLQTIDDRFLQLALKIASKGKVTKNEYAERASFLIETSLFQSAKYTRRFNSLDAMCNAAHLAEFTFASLPSFTRNKTCTVCNYSNERKFTAISINVDILLNRGLENIQEALNDTITLKQACVKCNNLCDINENYGPQIIIDTSILTDTNYLKTTEANLNTYNLDSIAKTIIINNNKYVLRGVINFLTNMRHYVALLFTGASWYEYDDLKSKRIEISPTKYNVTPHVLLYASVK